MDDRYFYRKQVVNGKTSDLQRIEHKLPRRDYLTCTIEMRIAGDRIAHLLNQDGQWRTLDEWSYTGGNFTQGSFGLLVRGRDETGLSNFAFVPAK
jgi:hypothetical protein